MRTYESLRQLHPCLGRLPGSTGRIHLPVSPVCNLSCRYCKRALTGSEERPGTSRKILPVEDTLKVLEKALALCPELTTVGIAGPGEALASRHATEAFHLVDQAYPEMVKCLSTNGLLLEEKADELFAVHVDAVTVTVNAVNPSIQAQINDRIFYQGRWISGLPAAEQLIRNQLAGIRKVTDLGVTVKVNTVLIPGINDAHVREVAGQVAAAGAQMYNIIPLIPQADMADLRAPDCRELELARAEASEYLDIFLHCQHCRADAVGRIGKEDLGQLVYGDLDPEPENFAHG